MTCSFRDIAERGSLRDFSLRDFIGGERQPGSLRELCNLHADGQALAVLWQNTFLLTGGELELGCDYTIGGFHPLHTVVVESKPAVRERAPQFGHRLAQAGYDVACLCEIFDDDLRDRVVEAWEAEAPLNSWRQGPSALPAPPPVRAPFPCPPSPWPPHLPGAAAVRMTLGNSGLLSLIRRHQVVDVEKTVFTDRGSPLIDIDPYSAKGVLKLSIALDGGVVSLFSTHVYAGGGNPLQTELGLFDPPSVEHKDRVKRAEFLQLRDFVQAEQASHPERMCLVCGDFNRDGTNESEEHYIDFVEIMAEANLRDLWALLQDSVGPTSIEENSVETTRERCPRDPTSLPPVGDSLHCSEQVTSSGGSRIDYIFVQDPAPEHTLDVFFRRPRRVYLEMDPEAGGLKYLSDHLGLDTVMYVRER